MQTGSIQNQIASESQGAVPEIGMGVTQIGWTDRHPYEVVEIVNDKKINIRPMKVKFVVNPANHLGNTKKETMEFESQPDYPTRTITKRKDGTWHQQGEGIKSNAYLIGIMQYYYDTSF